MIFLSPALMMPVLWYVFSLPMLLHSLAVLGQYIIATPMLKLFRKDSPLGLLFGLNFVAGLLLWKF